MEHDTLWIMDVKKSLFLVCTLVTLSATAAWAYRPLKGIALPSIKDQPVIVEGVTSSVQDEVKSPDLTWDTTVSVRNVSSKPVQSIDIELTMADIQGFIITRIVRAMPLSLAPQAASAQRLREVYLAWPGVFTSAQVKSVTFTDGTRWPPVVEPQLK
ncbi:MAG: hypothetical protein H7Y37_02120 [Anaerolineae bacterium]|nr:hypothetical protein [Gloeobacterales cyanobacterium ES-bin-313]